MSGSPTQTFIADLSRDSGYNAAEWWLWHNITNLKSFPSTGIFLSIPRLKNTLSLTVQYKSTIKYSTHCTTYLISHNSVWIYRCCLKRTFKKIITRKCFNHFFCYYGFIYLLFNNFVTSCVTCYVISNYMSFCCIVDSANQMYLRVIAQPCALGLQDVGERSWTRGVFDSNKSWLNTEMLFLTNFITPFHNNKIIINNSFLKKVVLNKQRYKEVVHTPTANTCNLRAVLSFST